MAKSLFDEKLNSGKFLVTTEIGPPKGTDVSEMIHHIELLGDKVDALNVTDHQSSVMRFPSLGGCLLIKEHGGEPILQMTTRDRNRLALQADLLLAYSRGIRNVLCLTGDSLDVGDHKEAKPVFDLDSVQLIRMIRTMESGKDLGGNDLKGKPEFCIGASVHPAADFIEPQLIKFEKKVAAGAEFFQTQGIFDLDTIRRFMQYARQFNVKILAGVIVLASARMARYMNDNVPGIIVPQETIDELASVEKGKALQKGIEIAAHLIKTIKEENLCHGVHIMAVGRESIVPDILEAAGLLTKENKK
ncbi:MAG: 5,10-methylenetetrahydrofolate reductase [Chloroflexi bacterium CG23_combo_of_CG06-09_8_20_14_all_45_10]|nr:MAG: 5,10-methylenetetrahydrofolate reductase [Chloroflexi bacterium CG23_combo_of_CG06-09_8_20_14_all_45_10]